MAQAGKIYPNGEFNRAPPPPGSYYNVKEQHLPAPAVYRRGRPGRGGGGCCCLLAWLCSTFAVLVVALGIAVLIFWLVVQPRAPKFDISNVQIDGLSSTASSTINTTITFELKARNPNKHMGIYYDNIRVNLETDGDYIGGGNLPSFYQGHKNTTYISGELKSENVSLDDGARNLLGSSSSNLPLYAKVDVKARVKVGSVKSPKIKVKVRCDLTVDLSRTTGSQLSTTKCKVKW